jgi:carbon monoxide dehydrogenase subunit G
VWTKLNDPEVLKACIPGCEELEKTEDNGFRAVAKMKVGPVSARFKGRVTLSDLDPPNGYKISGEGEGGSPASPRVARPWRWPTRTAAPC